MTLRCCDVDYAPPGTTRTILSGVDVAFAPGTLSVVTGPTGAGKTTLLYLLAGLARPTRGEVRFGGAAVSRMTQRHREQYRRRVGILFQTPRFFSGLSVSENVALPLVVRPEIDSWETTVAGALERCGCRDLDERRPNQLSVGQRQRVGLARALVATPEVLLADEPSAHQDETANLVARLHEERDRGAVVVVTSHDPRLIDGLGIDARFRLDAGALEPW